MKTITWLVTLTAAAGITAGCNRQSDESNSGASSPATNDTTTTASNTWENTKASGSNVWNAVKTGATNAWDGTKETGSNLWAKTKDAFGAGSSTNTISTNYFGYDYSMKDAFVSEAKTSLDDLDQQASSLSNRLASATDNTRTNLQENLQAINDKRAELGKKYDDIKNATQADWNDAKAAFAKSLYDVQADLKAGWDSVTGKM
jgi:hypothetical protein